MNEDDFIAALEDSILRQSLFEVVTTNNIKIMNYDEAIKFLHSVDEVENGCLIAKCYNENGELKGLIVYNQDTVLVEMNIKRD